MMKILVINLRFLGDVLLTTPLIRSLRLTYPNAKIDVLVYGNVVGMLEGNTDVSELIIAPQRASLKSHWQMLKRLHRDYDLAITTQSGDRPFLYALMASSCRIGVVPPKPNTGWQKRFFLHKWLEYDDVNTHTLLQHLKLLSLINVPPCFEVVPPKTGDSVKIDKPYIVLHPHPQWTYKQWTVEGWREIGRFLQGLGFKVVLTGSPAEVEMCYVSEIAKDLPDVLNLSGRLSLAQLSDVLKNAVLYIGVDTGITHLAAATGVPVIALYGATNPVKWSPFPFAYAENKNPFDRVGSKTVNNVSLLQGEKPCVPCHEEGCERHQQSRSACLDELSAERVKLAIRSALKI